MVLCCGSKGGQRERKLRAEMPESGALNAPALILVITAPSCSLYNDLQMFSGVSKNIFLIHLYFLRYLQTMNHLNKFCSFSSCRMKENLATAQSCPLGNAGCRVLDAIDANLLVSCRHGDYVMK